MSRARSVPRSPARALSLALSVTFSLALLGAACGVPEPGAREAARKGPLPEDGELHRDAGPRLDAGRTRPRVGHYPVDRVLSPLTPAVVAELRAIAARGAWRDDVFAKVGDSQSYSRHFMGCFDDPNEPVVLDHYAHLEPAVTYFRGGDADGTSPFARRSLATKIGRTVGWALRGATPAPIEQELAAIHPRYALIMYGTNDSSSTNFGLYARDLLALVDGLAQKGVVPIVTTVPRRKDNPDADARVHTYNAVMRAVAQLRKVPLVDLWRAVEGMRFALFPDEGIHLYSYFDPCDFTRVGLSYGLNVRNLRTLEILAQVKAVLVDGAEGEKGTLAVPSGSGTVEDPIRIATLPFSDAGDVTRAGPSHLAAYRSADGVSCLPTRVRAGSEVVYRFQVAERGWVRATALSLGTTPVNLQLLKETDGGAGATEGGCLRQHESTVRSYLYPGDYAAVVDSDAAGPAGSGEYLFTLVTER
ncbi:MAG: SGNH/GDSL hydrolase family protein [Deltaproteobacteria bacterium]|nr:SGNH/GDSL hydrolase family protein [Deltaproteobacteria bacterium]